MGKYLVQDYPKPKKGLQKWNPFNPILIWTLGKESFQSLI